MFHATLLSDSRPESPRFVPLVPLVPLVSLVSLVRHPKGEAINPDNRYKKLARQWKQAGTVTKNNLNALGRVQETRAQRDSFDRPKGE